MKSRIFITMFLLLGVLCSASAQRSQRQDDLHIYEMGKLPGKVYLFGFSQEFGDTTAYLSDVVMIDSLALQKKTGFLPFRQELSLQFKEYLEGKKGLKHQTACVFFSKSKASAEKKLAKMKKRYYNMDRTVVVSVPSSEFTFVHPIDKTEADFNNPATSK